MYFINNNQAVKCKIKTCRRRGGSKKKVLETKKFTKIFFFFSSETLTSLTTFKKNKTKPTLKIAELPSAILSLFCSSCRIASCIEMNSPELGNY